MCRLTPKLALLKRGPSKCLSDDALSATMPSCCGATWPTQAVSVSLNSSNVVPASPMRPVRSSYTGVLDGARDAAPLGAGGTEPAMGVAEADLGLAFCLGGAGGG